MEFEKRAKIMEKSWNFQISIWKNHGKKISHFIYQFINFWIALKDPRRALIKMVRYQNRMAW